MTNDEAPVDGAPARRDEAERPAPHAKHVREGGQRAIAVDLRRIVGKLGAVSVEETALRRGDPVTEVVGRRLQSQQQPHEGLAAVAVERQTANGVPEKDVSAIVVDGVRAMQVGQIDVRKLPRAYLRGDVICELHEPLADVVNSEIGGHDRTVGGVARVDVGEDERARGFRRSHSPGAELLHSLLEVAVRVRTGVASKEIAEQVDDCSGYALCHVAL